MSTQNESDLQSFHAFVATQLAGAGAELSPEEVLARWRQREQTITEVNEGLQAIAEGRTKSRRQFKSDFEAVHDLSDE